MDEETYTPSEAAKILRISKRQVTNMVNAGELVGEQSETGRWRIPQREVHRLLEQRRETGRDRPRSGLSEVAEGFVEAREYLERVEALQRELGRLEGRLEIESVARSTLEEQLRREQERADRLETELREGRRSWWSRLFGQ